MPSFCVIYRGGIIYELRYWLCFNIKKENMYSNNKAALVFKVDKLQVLNGLIPSDTHLPACFSY